MLVIYAVSILFALTAAAPVRYGQEAAPLPSTSTTSPSASVHPSGLPKHRRHIPILDALYQTFEAYDLTLESTYESEYDQLRDGSGWPFASGSGALMYVEQASKSRVQKRGRDLVIQEPNIQGGQYTGAVELSDEDDEPVP